MAHVSALASGRVGYDGAAPGAGFCFGRWPCAFGPVLDGSSGVRARTRVARRKLTGVRDGDVRNVPSAAAGLPCSADPDDGVPVAAGPPDPLRAAMTNLLSCEGVHE